MEQIRLDTVCIISKKVLWYKVHRVKVYLPIHPMLLPFLPIPCPPWRRSTHCGCFSPPFLLLWMIPFKRSLHRRRNRAWNHQHLLWEGEPRHHYLVPLAREGTHKYLDTDQEIAASLLISVVPLHFLQKFHWDCVCLCVHVLGFTCPNYHPTCCQHIITSSPLRVSLYFSLFKHLYILILYSFSVQDNP